MQRLLSLFLLLTLLTTPAYGVISPSYPYTLQNGTTADASQVMADFNQIQGDTNTNAAHNGANSDITSLTGLTTALGLAYGGTPIYVGGTSGGSANAQTLVTLSPVNFTLTAGFIVTGIAGASNTGATTLAANSLAAKAIDKAGASGPTALVGGEIIIGNPYMFYYDGTEYVVLNPTPITAGTLSVAGGGTGATTLTANNVILGNGTSAVQFVAPGSSGNVLTSNGTTWQSTGVAASNCYQATPSNPTGTTSASPVMMGLAGAITPAGSGKVMLIISGDITNSGSSGNMSIQLSYGTGSAPINGASLAGTQAGAKLISGQAAQAGVSIPFSVNAVITGLTPSTAYWLDLASSISNGNTVSLKDISISACEIK